MCRIFFLALSFARARPLPNANPPAPFNAPCHVFVVAPSLAINSQYSHHVARFYHQTISYVLTRCRKWKQHSTNSGLPRPSPTPFPAFHLSTLWINYQKPPAHWESFKFFPFFCPPHWQLRLWSVLGVACKRPRKWIKNHIFLWFIYFFIVLFLCLFTS